MQLVRACLTSLLLTVALTLSQPSYISAADSTGLFDSFTPFVITPGISGEYRARVVFSRITGGSQKIPDIDLSLDLRDDFKLTEEPLNVDQEFRFRFWRISVRTQASMRDFSAVQPARNTPGSPMAEARLETSGFRIGADFDVLNWGRTRLGINVDQDLGSPVFTEAVFTAGGGKKLQGDAPFTAGVHGTFSPPGYLFGISPIIEAKGMWPISGSELTGFEISGGISSAPTMLGSLSLQGGFIQTHLSFTGQQLYFGNYYETELEVTTQGWFAQLSLYAEL